MLGTELLNLLIVLAIIAGPFLLVKLTGGALWPLVTALIYAILAVIASAFIWSAGFGYGGWLMLTLPFSPLILLYGWLAAKLALWWRGRNAPPAMRTV